MRHKSVQLAAVLLSCLMGCEGLVSGQAPPGLRIVVVDGEGAINNIQLGAGREPVVQVRDENDKRVAGAKVTFSLPERGPGGTFFGALKNLSVTTNEQGRATGAGFRPNLTEGPFQIQVTAAQGDRTGAVNITQSNLPTGGVNPVATPDRKFWKVGRGKIIAILAAGGIIAAVAANRGGNGASTTTTPGTSITPGTVSVGTPR